MMIQVRFVSYQYNRWMRSVDRVKRIALSEKDNLPRKLSIDYIDAIRKNIYTGRYASTYYRYNRRYKQWKYQIFKSRGGFWHLRGELITALQSKQKASTVYTSRWFGGIPANVLDSGNVSWFGTGDKGRPMPIAVYAYYLEYGRRGQPSRPLFRPTLTEYARGKGLIRLSESAGLLKGAWR